MLSGFAQGQRSVRLLSITAAATFLAGIAFLLLRAVIAPRGEIDFRFFWLAGKIWATGGDPYSTMFEQTGAATLPDGNKVLYWFYPPQWWAICRLLALMSFSHAVMFWRLATSFMILGGTTLLVLSLVEKPGRTRLAYIGLACGFAALIEPTANVLAFGQSSGLIYLSFALLVAGVMRGSRWLVGVALLLATFKPQIGMALLFAMLFVPRYRISVLAALAGAGLLALPQLVAFGPLATLREFLADLQRWSALPSNTPLTSSGPSNLLARLGAPIGTMGYQMILAFAMLGYAGWRLRRTWERPLRALYLSTAVIVALVPLHIYDFTLILVPIALHLAIVRKPSWLAAVATLAVIRPGVIETLMRVPQYNDGVSRGLIFFDIITLLLLVDAMSKVMPMASVPLRQGARLQSSRRAGLGHADAGPHP